MLDDEAAIVGPQSTDFWILAAALKRFIDGEGKGSLPLEVANLPHTLKRWNITSSSDCDQSGPCARDDRCSCCVTGAFRAHKLGSEA